MAFKTSRFNYIVNDENGDLILYNTYKGIKSLHKVLADKRDYVEKVMKADKLENDSSEMFQKLVENGYIIDEKCDETQNLKHLYARFIKNDILKITILPTEQCNYRCKYCYESFQRGKMSKELQDAIIKYVEKNISRYNGLSVSWFGGEPLLGMDVIEYISERLMQICKKNKVSYIADITTNGYLLNLETIKKLYKYHVFTYQVTIDGIKETHDVQKPLANGSPTFDTVTGNLVDIKQNFKNKYVNILIRTNFTPEIYNHLEEYVDFFYERFHGDDRFHFFARPAGNWGGDTVKGFEDNLFKGDGFIQVLEKMLQLDKVLDYSQHLNFAVPLGSICMFSFLNTYLFDSAGNIRKCSCDLDNDRNIIGKLELDGTMNIDENERVKWVNLYGDGESYCKNCSLAPACLNNACMATKVLKRKEGAGCDVYEKYYLQYILKLVNRSEEIEVL